MSRKSWIMSGPNRVSVSDALQIRGRCAGILLVTTRLVSSDGLYVAEPYRGPPTKARGDHDSWRDRAATGDSARDFKREDLVEADHRCAIPTCRQTPVEIHHIVPLARVHEHTFDNLIALCPH